MTYHKTTKIYTYISSKTLVVLVTAYRYIHLELTFYWYEFHNFLWSPPSAYGYTVVPSSLIEKITLSPGTCTDILVKKKLPSISFYACILGSSTHLSWVMLFCSKFYFGKLTLPICSCQDFSTILDPMKSHVNSKICLSISEKNNWDIDKDCIESTGQFSGMLPY